MTKKSLIALACMAAMGESAGAGWARKGREDQAFGHELRAHDGGGLMANVDSTTLNANTFMQAFGNAILASGTLALTVNPTAADVLRVMRIPAGSTVSEVTIANDDLDSNGSPTIVHSIGWVYTDGSAGGSATAFAAAGETNLQAPNSGKVYAKFAPVTFEKDAYLTLTIGTASATFAAGSIYARCHGVARGVK